MHLIAALQEPVEAMQRTAACVNSYPSEIRRAIYRTNTIGSLNMTLLKVSKNRSPFPTDEAVFKLMF